MSNNLEYFVYGRFQPLTHEVINVVRNLFSESCRRIYVRVYVEEAKRGPKAPFSFDEVAEMWMSVFDVEIGMGDIVVLPTTSEKQGVEVLVPSLARAEKDLLRTVGSNTTPYDQFQWSPLPHKVNRAISEFDGKWKQYLHGHSPSLLSEPVRS